MATPIHYWTVKNNVPAISEMPDHPVVEELSAPKIQDNVVSATPNSGAKVKYRKIKIVR